jgi:hypothetical protein
MTAPIPENVSTWLVDWSIVAIMGNTVPPRELRACSGRQCLSGKTHSPPSFGAPPTRPRPTSERGASGAGSCGAPQSTSRTRSPWSGSSGARAASTSARLVSRGGWGEVRRPEPQAKECATLSGRQRDTRPQTNSKGELLRLVCSRR